VEITVARATQAAMNAAVEAAFGAIAKTHSLMSFHEAGSDVSCLNDQAWAKPVAVHGWTFEVLEAAIDLHRRSAGAFDSTVAPTLQHLGLLPRARDDRPLTSRGRAATEAIELLPGCRVRFRHPDTRIDLGGIAKGFAVDRAIDALREHGMPGGLVNAGGDLAVFGPGPHAVDIRDPRDPSHLLCRLRLSNEALASSASRFDALQSSEEIGGAVIDPRSRKPSRAIRGATVRAPCCLLADALTKVVMIAGPSAVHLLEHYRAGAVMVFADGSVQMTPDLLSAVCLAA
jgi:FAD:protein FMN transferase